MLKGYLISANKIYNMFKLNLKVFWYTSKIIFKSGALNLLHRNVY